MQNRTTTVVEDTKTASGRSRFASSSRFFEALQEHAQKDIAAKRDGATAKKQAEDKDRRAARARAAKLKL